MFSPQNERKPKSRMKFANEIDQTEHSNGPLNDRSANEKATQNGTPKTGLSDLTSELNSRTNSLLDYASSNGKLSTMSRAMQKAQEHKAKVVEFYLNGDPFKSQFRVTIMRNRDFPTFGKLLDHLTERTKLPIKFIFNIDGKRLNNVGELEHSNIYICSSTNKFYNAQYGSKALKSSFATTNIADIRPFLRPLSSKHKYNNSRQLYDNSTGTNSYNSSDSSLENRSMNGVTRKADNEENNQLNDRKLDKLVGGRFIKGKIVTIINRKLPVKSSRVLLNLRSARTFEHVVKDLGESVSLPMARILLTPFGNEVRSISQLRRSLNEIDTFFVDDLQLETIEDWNKRNFTKSHLNSLQESSKEVASKEVAKNKDELIERLSLAAGSSEKLNMTVSSTPEKPDKAKKVVMVTPVYNESLNKLSNVDRFDAMSIDSFDTLPDSPSFDQRLRTSAISRSMNSLNVPNSPNSIINIHSPNRPDTSHMHSVHPSFPLLNGFTAEFKIGNNGAKEMSDKQIQVDIRYLPIDEKFDVKRTNRFRNVDSQVPTFYVMDDVFGESFKQRSLRKTNLNRRELLFRSDSTNSRNNLPKNGQIMSRKSSKSEDSLDTKNNPTNSRIDTMSKNEKIICSKATINPSTDLSDDKNVERINESPELHNSTGSSLSEPNSMTNSRNSHLDEMNSFSNSVTPDQSRERRAVIATPSSNDHNTSMAKQTREQSNQVSQSNESNECNLQSNQFNNQMYLSNRLNQSKNLFKQNIRMNHFSSNSTSRQSSTHLTNQISHLNKLNQMNQLLSNKAAKFYESQLVDGTKVPDKKMRLKRIFGYKGNSIGNNLFILSTGEIAYYVGIFVVCWEPSQNVQRHYFEHTEDVCCMDIDHKNQLIVSVQQANKNWPPVLKVWNYMNLDTLYSFQNFDIGANVLSVVFSKSSFLLILVLLHNNIQLYYFDWRNNQIISKVQKLSKNEEVYGAVFHPASDTHFVSFGKRHLVQWSLENNELISGKTFNTVLEKNESSITCLKFLGGSHLVAADSEGKIYVWSVANEICEFESSVNELKAHDSSISSMLVFSNRYLVTGDISGVIKTWAFEISQFNLLNVSALPTTSGAIRSLSFASEILSINPDYFLENLENEKLYKIYIGTSANMIYSGSSLQATQHIILYEGHSFGVRTIAVDPVEKYFYTSGIDHKICKWSQNLLLWCVRCKYQCTSMAVYPSGGSLAVGCSNGIVCILSTTSSQFITQINLSQSAVGCLAYSPDNLLLAAGTENGALYLLPVFDNASSYDRISTFRCNFPILALQWSMDCKYILTSINDNNFQDILLWDLSDSSFKKGVSSLGEPISWYDASCFSPETSAVWENINLENVGNLCCHCSSDGDLIVTGDDDGYVRLFKYPAVEANAAFYVTKQSSNDVTDVRFLKDNNFIVTTSFEGSLYIWDLI